MSAFERSLRIKTSFAELYVGEAGPSEAAAVPIVFLHGNPDTHEVWSAVVERLKGTHRCFAPDLPGFGASDESLDVTLEAQATLVRELLDALGLPKCHLVIHDVGTTHGLAFVAASPANAARLQSLTIFNGTFFPDYRWHFWGRVWRTPVLGELSMLLGNETLFVNQLKKDAPKMPVEYVRSAYAQYSRKTRRQVLRFYRYLDPKRFIGRDVQLLEALKTVKHQVIWGDHDPYVGKQHGDRLGVHGTVHHLDCSHWAMAEEPERVAGLIRQLVAEG